MRKKEPVCSAMICAKFLYCVRADISSSGSGSGDGDGGGLLFVGVGIVAVE